MKKHLNIMGTRGVPARHSGYETFAAHLAPFLIKRGWGVTVYCQDDEGIDGAVDHWNGVERVHFVPRTGGTLGTMEFDAKTVRHVLRQPGIDLVLGYNTACFNIVQRLFGRRVAMNMDGIEWQRAKWGLGAKAWFYLNELVGGNIVNIPVADHPEMERHLRPRTFRKITMIPYGADTVTSAPVEPLAQYGLEPDRYLIKIGRSVPENSILEIIRAFSRRPRGIKLVVLGHYLPDNPYHVECRQAASGEVLFPGAIFEDEVVQPLRYHARAYIHGHTVGGTNPSLCEALGAGSAIVAHDNRFNRWVAGADQFYFGDENACDTAIGQVIADEARVLAARAAARARHAEAFTWDHVLRAYERMLERLL
jgi:glycosyltransferase involved in cell wall biosynthesis